MKFRIQFIYNGIFDIKYTNLLKKKSNFSKLLSSNSRCWGLEKDFCIFAESSEGYPTLDIFLFGYFRW